MKHTIHLLLAAAALAAAGACSTEEPLAENNGTTIAFRAAVGRETRAAETTVANLEKFAVTALAADGSTYFSDTYARAEQSWIPTVQHYWPTDNSELEFYAYAPEATALTGTFSITGTEQQVTGFAPAAQLKDQQDFIVAYGSGRKSAQGATGVQLTFRHALSQIEVRAKNAGKVYTYKVAGIRIGSVVSAADFTLPAAKEEKGAWTLGTDKADYVVEYAAEPLTLGTEAQSLMTAESGTAMLLPQQLTAWDTDGDKSNTQKGAFLAVKLNIVAQVDGNQMYPAEKDSYGWACIPVGTKWEPGYKYVYTLDFTNGAGKYPPEHPDVPGEDILTDPIRFTVEVEPWKTDEGDHNLTM